MENRKNLCAMIPADLHASCSSSSKLMVHFSPSNIKLLFTSFLPLFSTASRKG